MLDLLGACSSFGGRRNLAIMALAFPALIVVAISEPHFAQTARRSAAERDAATPALLADVADPLLSRLFPDAATPLQLRPILQSAHTSVFSEDWANWIGTPLADHAPFADANSCQGSFDKAVAIIDEAHPGWRAVGWARSVPRGRALHRIVLVDAVGLVRGYGLGGLGPDAQVIGMSALETAEDTGWIGAFTGSDPMSVTAYALLDGTPRRAACPLGMARKISHFTEVVLSNTRPADLSAGGYIDSVTISRSDITMSGWGLLLSDDNRVVIDTNLPVKRSTLNRYARPDVVSVMRDPRLADAGIMIDLQFDESLPLPAKIKLCVWTDDPEFGGHLLAIPSEPWLCPADGQ